VLLLPGQPIAFTLPDLLFQLGIELVMVDRGLEINIPVDADTDETA
jgi:hypothetical protein